MLHHNTSTNWDSYKPATYKKAGTVLYELTDTDLQTSSFNKVSTEQEKTEHKQLSHRLLKSIFGFSFKRALVLLTVTWSLITGLFIARRASQADSLAIVAAARLDPSTPKVQWPENTKVLASTIQDQKAYLYASYTNQLAKLMKDPNIHSPSAAHEYLERNGLVGIYRPNLQAPVSTPQRYGGWDKRIDRERYVLVVTGSEDDSIDNLLSLGDSRRFKAQANALKDSLASEFNVRRSNMWQLDAPSFTTFEQTLAALAQRAPVDSEVMIYIAAHGDSYKVNPIPLQGAFLGSVETKQNEHISETQLKRLIRTHFAAHANVTIIIDSCNSGAFIS